MRPLSDHNLISFDLECNTLRAAPATANDSSQPEIAKYDFKNADHLLLANALQATDWDAILGDANEIESANDKFANAIVTAARVARVPVFTSRPPTRKDRKMNALIREKTKLERQTSDERIRTTDKSAKVARIAAINK